MSGDFDFSSWNGRFALLDDDDLWLAYAIGEKQSKILLAAEAVREDAVLAARRMSAACIRSFLPSRRWIVGRREESSDLLQLGARYDSDASSWFIPDNVSGDCLKKLEAKLPRGPRRFRAALVQHIAASARSAAFHDRLPLEVPFSDRFAVKQLGAQYNAVRKHWFVSRYGPLKPFAKWLPKNVSVDQDFTVLPGFLEGPQFLRVPYDDEFRARDAGAVYCKSKQCWYAPEYSITEDFADWLAVPERISPRKSFFEKLSAMGFDADRSENAAFCILPDGKNHRFFVHGDFQKPSGEYVVFLNEIPVGWITNYRDNRHSKWVYPHGGDYSDCFSRSY